MKKHLSCLAALTIVASLGMAHAATVTVTVADNGSNMGVPGTFYWSLTNCNPGDTIAFAIPGGGPHFLQVPPGGFPIIYRKHGITIDGYTQPGASANSNPITAANNAQIKIVIDGRNNNGRDMDYSHFDGTLATSVPPIDNTAMASDPNPTGPGEWTLLGIYRSTNVTIKGLAFLADNINNYFGGIAFVSGIHIAHDYGLDTAKRDALDYPLGDSRNCHVAGCWFGVNPTNATKGGVVLCANWINFPRHQGDDGPAPAGDATHRPQLPNVGVTIGVAPGAANPRSEFNVFVGGAYHVGGEPLRMRISGNFIGMMPDGVTPYDMSTENSTTATVFGLIGSTVEFGRYGENYASSATQGKPMVIGTDGDGVNDADEGNLWGPIGGAVGKASLTQHAPALIHYYRSGNNIFLIAGNRWGIGVDGRRFTNSAFFMSGLYLDDSGDGKTKLIIGSDFASSRSAATIAAQANHFYNNWPLSAFGDPPATDGGIVPFLEYENPKPTDSSKTTSTNTWVSLRGNVLVGNGLAPINYANGLGDGAGGLLTGFTNFFLSYLDTNSPIIPTVNAGSVYPNLSGTFAPGIAPFTNVIIDVYQLDPEGWANGQAFALSELTDSSTFTNGFPQGRNYIGSFTVANTGTFNITLPTTADLGLGQVTVTVNYSQDPAGTALGRTATSDFSTPVYVIPGDSASVGLAHIVPDVALWYNSANYFTNGPVNPAAQVASLATWEPYIGLMGDSTFLFIANTFVDDGTAQNMRPALAFQPAAGGPARLGTMFYDDSGHPYTNKHHEFSSPQAGNLGRVGGDTRYGANNFMGGVAVAFYNYPSFFNSDGRFSVSSPFYSTLAAANGRDACVQSYSLNPSTLVQTPLSKALDSAFGRCCTNASYPATGQNQLARLQHTLGLSDGNFVSVVEDRSQLNNPAANATVATVFRPDGSVVKEAFKVADGDQWSNVAAFRGGFCVRSSGILYFFDNLGNLQGSVNQSTSGLPFGTSRGDETRIASDIRSYYVYLAGRTPDSAHGPVSVAIWDSRTRAFVTSATVSDTDPAIHDANRVNLAVDALDRFCVAYSLKPTADFLQYQVVARVMEFNGTSVTYLTHNFFPFINYDPSGSLGLLTDNPGVAMTTRQICISGNGTINSTNNPAGGPDTSSQTDVYTVLSHPAPVAAPTPTLTVTKSGGNLNLSWNGDDGLFTVQTTSSLSTPSTWSNATAGNVAPPVIITAGSGPLYVRLKR